MKGKKLLASVLSAAMVLSTMALPAFADDTDVYTVGAGQSYTDLKTAFSDAEDSDQDGVITYEIYGKVNLGANGWVSPVKKDSAVETVNFVGKTDDAEIVINTAEYTSIDSYETASALTAMNFKDLICSRPDGKWVGDLGHANNYFVATLRNHGGNFAGTVSYENCTFTNGVCNNFYGDTNFKDCTFKSDPGKSGLWIYGGQNTKVEGESNKFEGARGVKVYCEDAKNTGMNVTVKNAEFNVSEKPAIVSSMESTIVLENVDATKCSKGLLSSEPKDGRSDLDYADITVDGKAPVFAAKVDNELFTDLEAAKAEADKDPQNPKTVETFVAKVGDNYYTNFSAAFDAANAMTEPAVIDCIADEIITDKGRYAIKNSITINGNGATIKKHDTPESSVEFSTEELDADKFTKDIQFTVNGLNNIAVWGYRKSDVTFNVALNDCENVDRIYITGTDGTNNISVDGCTFTKYDSANNDTSIYSNNPGTLTVTNSKFINIPIAININNKSNGARSIEVSDCTFENCGEPSNTNNPKYAAPIRFVTTQEEGKITAKVANNTITNNDPSKKAHGDILLGDGRSGQKSTTNISVLVDNNNSDLTVKNEYPNGTASTSKTVPAGTKTTLTNTVNADIINLKFVKTADNVYDIVLNGDGKDINRLNAAEFKFNLDTADKITYEIKAADKLTTLQPDADKYVFYFDGKDFNKGTADSGADITIGTVTFNGYGTFIFEATEGKVTATTTADNLVTEFVVGDATGKGKLVIDKAESIINGKITVPTQNLTINVLMNHPVQANVAEYQDMTVAISGGDLAGKVLTYKLGNENKNIDETTKTVAQTNGSYNIKTSLTQNRIYTVTVSGAGYRTARYTVTMTADKTMNVWNNVMSNEITVVDDTKARKNFLAGDIIRDGIINIYDLSAVVAYFGTDKLPTSNPTYAKYDLNRDGVIDMMDISIVLTSWGE